MKHLLIIAALLFGLGAASGAAAEEEISTADAMAIHAVVQTQLDAFAEDDAVGAFELASLDTQTKIGSPDRFLHIVKKHYNPIYRHQSVMFSPPEMIDGEMIQIVRVTADDSHVWLAVYRMELDKEGSWKIDNCHLLETTSVSI